MNFDPYEYIAILVPGAVVVFAAMLLYPEVRDVLGPDGIELGGLGTILVGSFVVGHIVQALGNLLEWGSRRSGFENYSDQLIAPNQTLIAPQQKLRLAQALQNALGVELDKLNTRGWGSVRREMYVHVRSAGSTERIDVFNRNYGMHRGIAAGFLVAGAMTLLAKPEKWLVALVLLMASAVALFRMRRFAEHYARELVVEFIRTPPAKLRGRTKSTASGKAPSAAAKGAATDE